jgi:hypothetical protein
VAARALRRPVFPARGTLTARTAEPDNTRLRAGWIPRDRATRKVARCQAKGRTPDVIHLRVASIDFRVTDIEIPEGYPSGQRGQTVNLLAYAFGGSNPPPSTSQQETRIASGGGFEPPTECRFDKFAERI